MALPSLSKEQQKDIVHLINCWVGKITWSMIVEKLDRTLEISTTRQTLNTYPGIKKAYLNAKSRNRYKLNAIQKVSEISCEKTELFEKNLKLKAEVTALKQTIDIQLAFINEIIKESSANADVLHILNNIHDRLK
ncbi:hypothetical protein ACPV5O_25475 [Vibrio maritimus]|uniref:hypothetical protein n=1 Tax=Vibrio maritimus TaxID=990268 RepID=UPI004068F6F0